MTEHDSNETDRNPSSSALPPSAPDEATSSSSPTNGAKNGGTNGEGHGASNGETAEASLPPDGTTTKDSADAPTETGAPLLAQGNPLRVVRGGLTTGVAALAAFLLMAENGQLKFGVPLGLVFVAIAAFGIMDLVGSFDDTPKGEDTMPSQSLAAFLPALGVAAGGILLFGALLGVAATGIGSNALWGTLVTAGFAAMVMGIFHAGRVLGPWATDELGLERPLHRREGFWLVMIAGLLYLPTMGTFSLWDPWETHYGEVAREILARDDWISLWWAQDGWFWSKPILNFWMQSLAMASTGVHYQPDMMMQGWSGATARPEWVVRAPNVLLTIVGMYFLYKGVAKVFGRRAALFGGIVLATMPDWFFLAHQTMADMPYVAPMTAAMGLILLGIHTDENVKARLYEITWKGRAFRLSVWHLVMGAILVCALPQILYLLSRNVELVVNGSGQHGFRPHWDEFKSGSGLGNCGLPGNEGCANHSPATLPPGVTGDASGAGVFFSHLVRGFEPIIQALVWIGVLAGVLYLNWGERRVRRLAYLAAWFFAAIATMGKGPVGTALPMICAFAYIATKKRWSELLRLEIVSGLLIILAVALPWYVAMYVRHGPPFTDRLIFHDMFNRAFGHVHDTNEGDDTSFRFYIWQLGYAAFPWTGLVPLGLTYWLRRSDAADKGKGDVSVFLAMWFLFAFALFSFMGTKFHHYIFPAVPPAAMLTGIVLDEMVGDVTWPTLKAGIVHAVGLLVSTALLTTGAAAFFSGSFFGDRMKGEEGVYRMSVLGVVLVAASLATFILTVRSSKLGARAATDESSRADGALPEVTADLAEGDAEHETSEGRTSRSRHEGLMLGAASMAGALVLVLVGRDLAIKPEGADQPGAIRLLHLFTYNYRRPWPDSLDFSAALTGFTIVAVALGAFLAWKRHRAHFALAFLAFGFFWAIWGLDVYMTKTAPHWGQREVIEAYYKSRQSPDEPLVAYQMNWKGENFYTSNKVPAFVSTGANYTAWVKKKKDEGVKAIYLITEHNRTGGLRSETGAKTYQEITTKTLNNKFILVRAEF
ncbi:MAG: glycosyltransferase family 39 protein [Polyangiaceae bacterium]